MQDTFLSFSMEYRIYSTVYINLELHIIYIQKLLHTWESCVCVGALEYDMDLHLRLSFF